MSCCAGDRQRLTTSASCPPLGIVHQVNLEYLAHVVQSATGGVPDSLVGTDSHTTMINGLGVLGWGVGGIEAEACMLGQSALRCWCRRSWAYAHRSAARGATATDLVLTAHSDASRARRGRASSWSSSATGLPTCRSAIAPRSPTCRRRWGDLGRSSRWMEDAPLPGGLGRPPELVRARGRYCKEQGLFHTGLEEPYTDTLELALPPLSRRSRS